MWTANMGATFTGSTVPACTTTLRPAQQPQMPFFLFPSPLFSGEGPTTATKTSTPGRGWAAGPAPGFLYGIFTGPPSHSENSINLMISDHVREIPIKFHQNWVEKWQNSLKNREIFWKKSEKSQKKSAILKLQFEIWAVQRNANLVDIENPCNVSPWSLS